MAEVASIQLDEMPWIPGRALLNDDPTDTSVMVRFLGDDQERGPWCMYIKFDPNVEGSSHWHAHDTIYILTAGEFTIGDGGTFRPGDVRWVRAGHFLWTGDSGSRGRRVLLDQCRAGRPPELHPEDRLTLEIS